MTADTPETERMAESAQLTLLGTVHGDPRGFERLRLFLEIHRPDLILIELSPFGWAYRKVHRRELNRTLTENLKKAAKETGSTWSQALAHPEIRAIRRQVAFPFEYRASHQYAQTHGKRIFLVDWSDFSRAMIASWPELLSTTNLACLLSQPPLRHKQAVEDQYRRARALLCGSAAGTRLARSALVGSDTEVWQKRERYLAKRVLDIMLEVAPTTCVYVGGWEHLCQSDERLGLRELLGAVVARCYLLDEFDPRGTSSL